MQFRRLTRISTGISIRLMRRLYIAVALPKMTYALDVWYTPPTKPLSHRRSTGSVGVLRQMVKLQRLASLSIVGGMKSTPTDLLDAHTGLLPIELTLLRLCHRAAVRKCTLPQVHPLHPLVRTAHRLRTDKHLDPITSALRIFKLDPSKFETIKPDTTPRSYFSRVKTTISKTREESVTAEENDTPDFKIFTDGSGYNGRTGAAAILFKKGTPQAIRSLTYHLGDLAEHSILEAELVGILLAAWLLRTTPGSARFSFSIYTDSQTSIRFLGKRYTGSSSYIIDAFRNMVDTPFKVNWISGHSDVRGNMKADDLAILAAQGRSSPAADLPPLLRKPLPLNADAEKRIYDHEIRAMWKENWLKSPRRPRMEKIDKSFPFTNFRKLLRGHSRAQSSLLIQIRSGHIPLNAHLYKLNCVDSDKCQACHTRRGTIPTRETITHFLFDCPAYQDERHYPRRRSRPPEQRP
jgi:ribonuclease HI